MPKPYKAKAHDKPRIVFIPIVCIALVLMTPPIMYVLQPNSSNPAQLVTSICITLLAAVLVLWIYDATDLIVLRAPWMSKAIYGIGVAGILSASVGLYKNTFSDHLHPLDGLWKFSCKTASGERLANNKEVILYYNKELKAYVGYSSYHNEHDSKSPEAAIHHLQIENFDAEQKSRQITFNTIVRSGRKNYAITNITIAKGQSSIKFSGHPIDDTNVVLSFEFIR